MTRRLAGRTVQRFVLAVAVAAAWLLTGLDRPLVLAQNTSTPTSTSTSTSTPTATPTPTSTVTTTPAPTATVGRTPVVTPTVPILVITATPVPTSTPRTAPDTPSSGPVQVQMTYPPEGQIINSQPFLVMLNVSGIQLNAAAIGTSSRPNEGHWVLLIDEVPVASGDALQFSVGNVPEGLHTLTVQIRNNDRSPLTPPVETSTLIDVGGVGLLLPPDLPPGVEVTPGLPEVPGGLPRTGDPVPVAPLLTGAAVVLFAIGAGMRRRR